MFAWKKNMSQSYFRDCNFLNWWLARVCLRDYIQGTGYGSGVREVAVQNIGLKFRFPAPAKKSRCDPSVCHLSTVGTVEMAGAPCSVRDPVSRK